MRPLSQVGGRPVWSLTTGAIASVCATQLGGNLPIVVKPDCLRSDPPVGHAVTLKEIGDKTCGWTGSVNLPVWVELTDGERTVLVQASGVRATDGRVIIRAEVGQ